MNREADAANDFAQLQLAVAGRWSIERELGVGGMGKVYLAREVSLDRPVALKVLHPELANQPEQRSRFLSEARTGAQLSHPNIVPIYAVEEHEDVVFFAMGLVDGDTLGERVRREGPLPVDDAERVLSEVGWALAYAHAMGIVHRDVTLENILIERSTGRALLADFGIASTIDGASEGPLLGTPTYLAPEIIQGEAANARSDLYSLCVAGWYMLAGRPPFLAADTPTLLLQHLTHPVPPLQRAAPGVSLRLARSVECGLLKDPAARPLDVESWLSLLQQREAGYSLAPPLRRWVNRWDVMRPAYALAMTVVAMLTVDTLVAVLDGYQIGRNLVRYLVKPIGGPALMVFGAMVLVHLVFELWGLRRLARAGFGIEDLRLAIATRRREERRAGPRPAPLLGRVVNDLAWLGAATVVVLGLVIFPRLTQLVFISRREWLTFNFITDLLSTIGQWAYVAFWAGMGFNLLVPATASSPDGLMARVREWFWSALPGRVMLRVSSFNLARHLPASETLHRPTELVLDLAIDDLWQSLPATTRASLGDLPELSDRLRSRISELRDLEVLLHRQTLLGSDEALALRDRLLEKQVAGVTALERLRLLLGNLGSAASSEGEFTAQLADARSLEQELLAELGAHASLQKALRKVKRPTGISLEPTPA